MLERIENGPGRGLHIAHLNFQRLTNKIDLIKLHIKYDKFDIRTISATWLNKNHKKQAYNLEGYELFRLDRDSIEENGNVKRRGCVAIYISSKHQVIGNKLSEYNTSNNDIEMMWVLIENTKQINFAVASVYTGHQGVI